MAWLGNLDALDVAMMDLLSHAPWVSCPSPLLRERIRADDGGGDAQLYLLATFYAVQAKTAVWALAVDVLSAAVPFALLRPLSRLHRPSAKRASDAGAGAGDAVDPALQLLTAGLSTGVYSVTLVLSLRLVLPRVLVLYFARLPTVAPAYAASYASVLPMTAVLGAAASLFIFAPLAATGRAAEDEQLDRFDAATATLGETLRWNAWGYTARTKVAIARTAAVASATAVNTYLACTMTVRGVEATGAAAYAAVWVLAALATGLGLALVGCE